MLRASDIIHKGLRDVYATLTTTYPTPPVADHRRCFRMLNALNAAMNVYDTALVGYGLAPIPGGTGAYSFTLTSGQIIFNWNGGYAQNVDWK
jgi:hypothetical protein